MALGFLATKIGMTQIFTESGVRVPVTVLKVESNVIVQKRTAEKDGYTALQIGYGDKREKNVNQPEAGHFKKAGVSAKRELREFRVDGEVVNQYEVGDELPLSLLQDVRSLDIAGTSKGKGFAGVMKRHNMAGFRATHGTHEYFRHGGSIGCRAKPGKVFKGKKMPGQMGNTRVRTINLAVEGLALEEGLVFIRGAVPGSKGGIVELTPSQRTANRGRGVIGSVEVKSKNPMKASKAGA